MKKISSRIKLISFILSLMLVVLITVTVFMNEQSKHDGYVIHIAGKERMLTQKIAKEIFLNLYTQNGNFEVFSIAKNEFLKNLQDLQLGTKNKKITPPPTPQIAKKLQTIQLLAKEFFIAAEIIKAKSELGIVPKKHEIQNLYNLNNKLLNQIDITVQAYSAASEEKINRLQWIQYIGAFATLVVVIGSILLSRKIDEEFELFLNNAKKVSQIHCGEFEENKTAPKQKAQNELVQAQSDMKTFLLHVSTVVQKARNALAESKNTLVQIEDVGRTVEQQLKQSSLSGTNKEEISDYIDIGEDLTIGSLEKIAKTQQMLDKFQSMLEKMVERMEQGGNIK